MHELSAETRSLAAFLRVLSDPTRLAIFNLLFDGVHCNCEIGSRLELPMNLVSHHLGVLREAGLVKSERDANDARWVYYSIDEQGLQRLQLDLESFLAPARIRSRRPSCRPRAVPQRAGTMAPEAAT